MQSFPGLMFDGSGISFQVVHVLFELGVFFLQLINFLLEGFVFRALLLVFGDAVVAENDAKPKEHCKDDCQAAGNATPRCIEEI